MMTTNSKGKRPKAKVTATARLRRLRVRARAGDAEAQYELAEHLRKLRKWETAARWYLASSEQNHSTAQVVYGGLLRFGVGVQKDLTAGFGWALRGAQGGNSYGMYIVGTCYSAGEGVAQDFKKAEYWLKHAARLAPPKESEAHFSLGLLYDDLGKPTQAIEWYRAAAKWNNASAAFNLGLLYEKTGKRGRAIASYRQAVKSNHTGALYNLAHLCTRKEAVRLYLRAAKLGESESMLNLGVAYFYGNGVQKNQRRAVSWYRQAAEQGEIKAKYNLGLCYKWGDGVKEDIAVAHKLFLEAASTGHKAATKEISKCRTCKPLLRAAIQEKNKQGEGK